MTTIDRRLALGATALCLAAATGLGALSGKAMAQGFPTKPITVIVPYAPGVTDREARKLAELASQHIGQTITVDNKPGAGGTIGAQFVANSAPDGYTLLYGAPAVVTIAPLLNALPYSYDSLVPVARGTASPHVLAARADAPFKTLPELISYAKANPGKVVFGSSGTGTAVHLAGSAFANAAGIEVNHVPFKGLNPAITAALGGHVDIVAGLPIAIIPQVEGGKMNALAQFGAKRSPALPNVPTLQEQNVPLTLGVDLGLFAPKGTPAEVIAKIGEAYRKAVESEEFKAFAAQAKGTPGFLDAAAYKKVVDADRDLYTKLVPALGLGKK